MRPCLPKSQSLVNPFSVPSVHCQGPLCASACVQVLPESRGPPMPMSKCVSFISLHDSLVIISRQSDLCGTLGEQFMMMSLRFTFERFSKILVWEVRHFGGHWVWHDAVSFVVKNRTFENSPSHCAHSGVHFTSEFQEVSSSVEVVWHRLINFVCLGLYCFAENGKWLLQLFWMQSKSQAVWTKFFIQQRFAAHAVKRFEKQFVALI